MAKRLDEAKGQKLPRAATETMAACGHVSLLVTNHKGHAITSLHEKTNTSHILQGLGKINYNSVKNKTTAGVRRVSGQH